MILFTRNGRCWMIAAVVMMLAGDYFMPVELRMGLNIVVAALVVCAVFRIKEKVDADV